jgi:hypothetical protein
VGSPLSALMPAPVSTKTWSSDLMEILLMGFFPMDERIEVVACCIPGPKIGTWGTRGVF